ncbi:MAG: hypothetical protein KDN05_20890, partial [Verrucomicrobiae bacterium]|nr:hypothetical protein [Verrucomicrobiae bacterium]
MTFRTPVPLLVLTAGLLAGPRVSAVLRHPDMTDAQAIAIAELPQFQSRARISGCSAAMLTNEWMVSAAHCTNYAAEQRVTATYTVGGTTYSRGATAYRVTIDEPGVDDVLLVHLDSPIPQAVAWTAPYDGFDEFDRLGWKLGYGWSGVLSNPVQVGGTCRGMTQFLRSTVREGRGESSVDPQFLFYNYNGSPEAAPPSEFTTLYEGGTGPGDSGGPMYVYSRGRFFNASVTSGPDNGDYRDGRLSTHLTAMVSRLGFTFAYPQPLESAGTWTAQDLAASLANHDPVDSWFDTTGDHAWSRFSDGGTGAPLWIENATPTGLAALRFDGDDAMGLPASANPFADGTALSVALVIRADNVGSGSEATPFGTTGLLDSSDATNGWGLSFSPSGRCGIGVEDRDGAVQSIFRGGAGNASLVDGNWHVLVATWDGSEIAADKAGDDRNLK